MATDMNTDMDMETHMDMVTGHGPEKKNMDKDMGWA
jgi:hypothetical protein